MSVARLPLSAESAALGLKLAPYAVAKPALSSHIRPALVLPDRETRDLLEEARKLDVSTGGVFSAGPAGIQVWSKPFDGPNGAHGTALHLGSVDWSYDTPSRHYATVYRAMVTAAGIDAGETTASILARVLDLVGLPLDGSQVALPLPPPRDPFRSSAQLAS